LTLVGSRLYSRAMETESLSQELSAQDRLLLVFGYIGPLALVALIASRREFVKWHAKQGLVLSAIWWLLYVLLHFLDELRHSSGLLAAMASLLWVMAWLVVAGSVLAALVCIIRGLEGERFKIPLLGDLADRL
jgi:uncharacterized membrane protein